MVLLSFLNHFFSFSSLIFSRTLKQSLYMLIDIIIIITIVCYCLVWWTTPNVRCRKFIDFFYCGDESLFFKWTVLRKSICEFFTVEVDDLEVRLIFGKGEQIFRILSLFCGCYNFLIRQSKLNWCYSNPRDKNSNLVHRYSNATTKVTIWMPCGGYLASMM